MRLQSIDRQYINLYNECNTNVNLSIMKSSRTVIDPEVLRSAAAQAVAALKLLANEQRLLLLCQLSQGEMCVSDLEECLDIHQPTLSQQLGVLRSEAVVNTRREGKNIFYSVADPALLEILAVLYRLYCPKEK
jgi:DNA-binding transcriptional ArsR family regulator